MQKKLIYAGTAYSRLPTLAQAKFNKHQTILLFWHLPYYTRLIYYELY